MLLIFSQKRLNDWQCFSPGIQLTWRSLSLVGQRLIGEPTRVSKARVDAHVVEEEPEAEEA